VADYALQLRWLDDVRAVVAEAARRGLCSVDEVAVELDAGPRHGSALLRRALADVAGGAWSAPEARAARLLRAAGIPPFEQNTRIELPGGRHYVVDFLWRELHAILEIDSVEHHLDPADWAATMDRHLALETLGFSVAHRPPSAVRDHPQRFVHEISAWLASRAALLAPPLR
jgi:very-short-patch-repair endonuclease